MKRKLVLFGACLLAIPFLMGHSSGGVKLGNFTSSSNIGPLTMGVDCSGSVTFTPTVEGYYRYYIEFESGNSGGVRSFPNTIISRKMTPTSGRSVTYSIDGDWIAESGNTITLYVYCTSGTRKGQNYSNTAYLDGAGKVYTNCQPGVTYAGGARVGYFSSGKLQDEGYSYSFSGFDLSQYGDGKNYLSLFDGRLLASSEMVGATTSMEADVLLRGNNNLGDFQIGNASSSYRYFALDHSYVSSPNVVSSNYSLRLSGSHYLDTRNLHMYNTAENSFCAYTNKLFIPAGLGKVGSTYRFSLIFSDLFGLGDYLSYEISYTRLNENMGNGLDSDYLVVGGSL